MSGFRLRQACDRVYLSGVLADDPQRDEDRNGDPVLLLTVAFPVAERHRDDLRLGESILITGQLSGGGGVIATEIHLGPPPG